ncbi:MAG: RnfABCDGE type electron transport complex subunit D [Clostridia bacterium]|nr:RnfABCDGE type electron transport complex subunit D [Clostridia bacterium]
MERKLLNVSHFPHIRHQDTTRSIMGDVIIALVPSLIWGAYIFGVRVLSVVAVSVLSCVISEAVFCLVLRKNQTVGDLSAVVTGIILACTFPAAVPLWIPAVSGVFAIVFVKQLFGGIGKNILNPAAAARVLACLFPQTERYSLPFEKLPVLAEVSPEGLVSEAIYDLKDGIIPPISLFDMFIGNSVGGIGTVSCLLLVAGGLYLVVRKIISVRIPLAFLLSAAAMFYLFPKNIMTEEYMIYHLLSGGLVFCSIFMATDFSTSPMTGTSRIIFGAGCGVITVFLRYMGFEGVYTALIIMNLSAGLLDRITLPRPFGKVLSRNKKTKQPEE